MLPYVLTGVISAAVAAVLFFIIGYAVRKNSAEKAIGSAEAESKRIIEDATKAAETVKKEKLIYKIVGYLVKAFSPLL